MFGAQSDERLWFHLVAGLQAKLPFLPDSGKRQHALACGVKRSGSKVSGSG